MSIRRQLYMCYQPIENYGVIGDLHSVALVGMNGSIDWLCFPNFDSPCVFGAMLDDKKGGRFQIAPTVEEVTFKQLYWPETNVLVTRFLSAAGVGEITDYMPIGGRGQVEGKHQLVRRVRVVGINAVPHGVPACFQLCARHARGAN